LHHVDVMRPGPRNTFPEEQFVSKPRFVVWYVVITQSLKRFDAMGFRFRKASHANKQVNDWLCDQARHRRAADVLACDEERAESSVTRPDISLIPSMQP